jgi:hypothetical protein
MSQSAARGPPAKKPNAGRRGAAAPRLDAANLAGITTLMNPQHVKSGVNLEESEKSVMGKNTAGVKKADGDPVRIYTAELNQLAEELGIDLLDDGGAPPSDKAAPLAPAAERPRPGAGISRLTGQGGARVTDLIDDLDLGSGDGGRGDGGRGEEGGSEDECDCDDDCPDDCDCACHDDDEDDEDDGSEDDGSEDECECDCDDDCPDDCDCACHDEDEGDSGGGGAEDDEKVDHIISRLEDDLGIKTDGRREKRRNRIHGGTLVPHAGRRGGPARVTDEQERRRHINSVVSDIRGETRTTFGVERERVQDIKASKLEQIGQLRMTLEEEGIDCNGVSNPTSESPMEEIDSVLNILRLKNDRNRYSSLAEEVILGFAEGIETVFDGSRAVPLVGWRPDYTGYHNTVNIKLHRMRFETSQVVGNIIEKYNVGPTARIVMELLPSFFLYPRQQKKQRGAPGLSSDPHVSDARLAMGSIRASDERQTLDDVRRL